MEYNIIEDTKKTKVNVSIYGLCNLAKSIEVLMKTYEPSHIRMKFKMNYEASRKATNVI